MSDETETNCEVVTCGVSISADRAHVTVYLGSTESDRSFEFVMPKDLALHMSSTIQSGASRGAKALAASGVIRPAKFNAVLRVARRIS